MGKSNQEILATFKKANKTRRTRMAEKAGFASADEYRTFLETGQRSGSTTASTEKPVIHIINILDASSSMQGSKFNHALSGINDEFAELRKDKEINYFGTFVTFSYSERIKSHFTKKEVGRLQPVYPRADGMTALFDAIGDTLTAAKNSYVEGEKVLVNIFTDGAENASRRWKVGGVKELIKVCESLGFTITFVGTESDVALMTRLLDIDESNTLVHQNTGASVQESFNTRSMATKQYASKVLKGEDTLVGFYKSNEKL